MQLLKILCCFISSACNHPKSRYSNDSMVNLPLRLCDSSLLLCAARDHVLGRPFFGNEIECNDVSAIASYRLLTKTTMKAIEGYFLITPDDLHWRPSNLMKIPNADFLERTGSENLSARLWRLPSKSASTLHKHIRQEEFYFVLEGVGRMRVGDETLTVPKYGGVLVGPGQLRQVFNDTDTGVLWLIVGAPEETEFLPGAKTKPDMSLIYPVDPKQLPKELVGVKWPPKD
jgi:mannose-6-phosphate isomerase-like protein (cupin superfamily)